MTLLAFRHLRRISTTATAFEQDLDHHQPSTPVCLLIWRLSTHVWQTSCHTRVKNKQGHHRRRIYQRNAFLANNDWRLFRIDIKYVFYPSRWPPMYSSRREGWGVAIWWRDLRPNSLITQLLNYYSLWPNATTCSFLVDCYCKTYCISGSI